MKKSIQVCMWKEGRGDACTEIGTVKNGELSFCNLHAASRSKTPRKFEIIDSTGLSNLDYTGQIVETAVEDIHGIKGYFMFVKPELDNNGVHCGGIMCIQDTSLKEVFEISTLYWAVPNTSTGFIGTALIEGMKSRAMLRGIPQPIITTRQAKSPDFTTIVIESPIENKDFWLGFIEGSHFTTANRQTWGL
jgi:hypothetical protein